MPWSGFSPVSLVQLGHLRLLGGWYRTHVGHDISSASPSGSLLPSTIIIVLALVNSAASTVGDL